MQEFIVEFFPWLFIAGMAALVALFVRWERRQARTWTVVAEGAFQGAEHRTYAHSSWSGMPMVPVLTSGTHALTIIRLQDGRSFVVDGRLPAPPEGTPVRLLRNGLGAHALERLS